MVGRPSYSKKRNGFDLLVLFCLKIKNKMIGQCANKAHVAELYLADFLSIVIGISFHAGLAFEPENEVTKNMFSPQELKQLILFYILGLGLFFCWPIVCFVYSKSTSTVSALTKKQRNRRHIFFCAAGCFLYSLLLLILFPLNQHTCFQLQEQKVCTQDPTSCKLANWFPKNVECIPLDSSFLFSRFSSQLSFFFIPQAIFLFFGCFRIVYYVALMFQLQPPAFVQVQIN